MTDTTDRRRGFGVLMMKRKILGLILLALSLTGCFSSLTFESGLTPVRSASTYRQPVGWVYRAGDPVLPYSGYYSGYYPYGYCYYCQ